MMRIAAIVERAVGLEGGRRGGPANAVVNFSGHTVSLVAVITDVIRAGGPWRVWRSTRSGGLRRAGSCATG
ncbi:mandelate racemase/muconate lactonizing enzyme domain protein [Mycobacterium intracellulare 1956]|uniref:Mandelate racemase/muconate lactonizing enzyme domain protein n=1 Tax=Mycobacterium intracellulare 1956 TaxID=1299331 RepID=X8CC11_MYCIT|nr:mandelate racemase/muconate lactonizing enzyme domain protein [Mycobacterium intracellulare 1956]